MKKIPLKTPAEIIALREGGKILALILRKVTKLIKPGISTGELNRKAEKIFQELGATPSFKGYHGFPAALCTSVNEGVVHNIPDFKQILKHGDIISIDAGVFHKGLHTDSCITIGVGDITPQLKKFKDTVKDALFQGIKQVYPGSCIGNISAAIQNTVEAKGYSVVRETIGHGVGRQLHEPPEIPNFGRKNTGATLVPNMVLAIEPIIALGRPQIKTLPDNWTVKTKDGSPVAHFEHTILVTENGFDIITK